MNRNYAIKKDYTWHALIIPENVPVERRPSSEMNGSTHSVSDADRYNAYRFVVYITEGLLNCIFNGLLVCTIAKHEALRDLKEYVIIAGLALADAFTGFGTVCSGIWRIPKLLNGTARVLRSRRECFFSPHNICWAIGLPLGGMMLFVVSLDRLLLVLVPERYLSFTRTYALRLVGSVYAFCLVQFVVMGVRVWPSAEDTVSSLCMGNESVVPSDFTLYFNQMTVASMTSIVLYVLFASFSKKRTAKLIERQGGDARNSTMKTKLEHQRRLTKTIGVTCFCTFIFYVIPSTTLNISHNIPWIDYRVVSVYSFMVSNLNPICNLLIFTRRQREIRMGLKALFTGKIMPPTLQGWNLKQQKR